MAGKALVSFGTNTILPAIGGVVEDHKSGYMEGHPELYIESFGRHVTENLPIIGSKELAGEPALRPASQGMMAFQDGVGPIAEIKRPSSIPLTNISNNRVPNDSGADYARTHAYTMPATAQFAYNTPLYTSSLATKPKKKKKVHDKKDHGPLRPLVDYPWARGTVL